MKKIVDMLVRSPIFSDLTPQELEAVSQVGRKLSLPKGQFLYRAGETCDAIFLIVDGKLDLIREAPDGRTQPLIRLGQEAVVGDYGLVQSYAHTTSAIAAIDAEIVVFSRADVEAALAPFSHALTRLLKRVAVVMRQRLQYASSRQLGMKQLYYSGATRLEHDLLGERMVPRGALYGVQTLRAIENFPITGIDLSHFPELVRTLTMVKQAAARANRKLGLLKPAIQEAIDRAGEEILDGHWHGHFVVDMIQGGAGTSTNMNANEVIANRALELLGHERGDYAHCHPNNHVNLSQSTNDVYPTAVRLAAVQLLNDLIDSLAALQAAFALKGDEFKGVLKMGRTQLQDAVPMTLGQEFSAYAVTIGEDICRLRETSKFFLEINLGGTAIGTGINADPRYPATVVAELRAITGLDVVLAENLVEATPDTGAFVLFSGVLKRVAVKLSKICNDLRLLSSGPRCGFNEINLPPMQPGSSIMPGKVNPVIPEVVNQVAFQVIGNDLTITLAAEAGQLQLNVMEPVISFNLFQSMNMLTSAIRTLTERCVRGITANADRTRAMVEESIGIVTALVPALGYEKTSEVAKEALLSGRPVRDIVLEKGYLSSETLDELLSIEAMTSPRVLLLQEDSQ